MNARIFVVLAVCGLFLSGNAQSAPTLVGAVNIPFAPASAFVSGGNQYYGNAANLWSWVPALGGGAGGSSLPTPCPAVSNYFVNDTGAIFCVNPASNTLNYLNGQFVVQSSWNYTAPINASNVQYSIKSNLYTILSINNNNQAQFQVFNTATQNLSCSANVNLSALSVTGQFGGVVATLTQGIIFGVYSGSQRVYYQAECGATTANIFLEYNGDDDYDEVDIISFNNSNSFLSIRTWSDSFSFATFTKNQGYNEYEQNQDVPNGQFYWRINDTYFAVAMEQEGASFDWNITIYTWANATTVVPVNGGYNYIDDSSTFMINNASNAIIFNYEGEAYWFNTTTGSVTYVLGLDKPDGQGAPPVFMNNGTIITFTNQNVSFWNQGKSMVTPFVANSFYVQYNTEYAYAFQNENGNCEILAMNTENSTANFVTFKDCSSCVWNSILGDVSFINGSYMITYQCDEDVHMLANNVDYDLGYDVPYGRPGLAFPNYANQSVQIIYQDDTNNEYGTSTLMQYGAFTSSNQQSGLITTCGFAQKLNNEYALIADCSTNGSIKLGVWNVNTETYANTPINVELTNVTHVSPIGVTFAAGAVPTIDQYLITVTNPTNISNLTTNGVYIVSSGGAATPFSVPNSMGGILGWNETMAFAVHSGQAYFASFNANGLQIGLYNVTASVTPASGVILAFSSFIALLVMMFAW